MDNLLDLVKGQLTPDLIQKASGMIGESPAATGTALGALAPTLLSAVAEKGSTPDGATQLLGAMAEHKVDDGLLGNITGMLGGAGDNNLLGMGGPMVNMLLGNKSSGIFDTVASVAGIKPSSTGMLAALLMPIIGGLLSKQIKTGGMGAAGLASMLMGQKDAISAAAPKGLEGLLGSLGGVAGLGAAAGALGGAANLGKGALGGVADLGKGALGGAANLGKGALGGVADLGKGALGGVADLGKGALGGAADLGKGALGGAADLGKGALGGAANLGKGALGGAANLGKGAISGAGNVAASASGGLPKWLIPLVLGVAVLALGWFVIAPMLGIGGGSNLKQMACEKIAAIDLNAGLPQINANTPVADVKGWISKVKPALGLAVTAAKTAGLGDQADAVNKAITGLEDTVGKITTPNLGTASAAIQPAIDSIKAANGSVRASAGCK